MKGNLRKIVVGKDFSSCVTYVVGGRGAIGTRVSAIVETDKDKYDIYVSNDGSQIWWKTIEATPLEKENNVELK